jgi:hypothetical protein
MTVVTYQQSCLYVLPRLCISRIMSRFVPVTCPSVSGLGRLSLIPVSFFDTFSPCTSFLVPALSWCRYYSGASIAPVAAPLWCEEMLTNISSGDLLGFASGIYKALVSAKSRCQQSPGVSKVLRLYFFSRHPSSPITLLLPLSFPPRHIFSPVTVALLSLLLLCA